MGGPAAAWCHWILLVLQKTKLAIEIDGKYHELSEQKQLDETRTIEIEPKHSQAYYNRGLTNFTRGHYDNAISDYSKAIDLNPNYAKAYENRRYTYFVKLDDRVKACSDFKKACELGMCKAYEKEKALGHCI